MNLCLRSTFLVFMIMSFNAFAQHSSQPTKESSDDLRDGLVMFQIQDLEDKSDLWLERTVNLDYFLRYKEKKDEKIIKLSAREAKKLDMEFASKFLKCQYELPASPEGCKPSHKLTMKGDVQEICGKDEIKTQEILPFAKELQKKFK
jgi:hypothetical protein